jgi:predicted dehydrogenase
VVTARVGVVGAGWWATRVHLPSLATYERARIVAVADRELVRAVRAADSFGGRAVPDLDAMLDVGVDAVVIATTHDTHFPLARDALLAGVDVLVEKPMVIDPDEGFELVDTARRCGRRLHVGYPYPHSGHARSARATVTAGNLGALDLVTSTFATPAGLLYRPGPRFDVPDDALVGPDPATYRDPQTGGQARGQMTHSLSLLLFVTGLTPSMVTAFTTDRDVDVDMVDVAAFSTTEGVIGTAATTGAVPIGVPTAEAMAVYGRAGHLQYDMSGGRLAIHADNGGRTFEDLQGADRYPEHLPVRHLVDCVLDDTAPLVDGRLGAVTAAFIDALLRSADDGTPRAVPSEWSRM